MKVAAGWLQMWLWCQSIRLTVQDVSEALGTEQLFQTSHFVLQVPHQLVVGILVDDCVALDVLGSVSITMKNRAIKELVAKPQKKKTE